MIADYAIFPRALFAADHRRSISFTAILMLGRYFRAATSCVINDEKKIRFTLPRTERSASALASLSRRPVRNGRSEGRDWCGSGGGEGASAGGPGFTPPALAVVTEPTGLGPSGTLSRRRRLAIAQISSRPKGSGNCIIGGEFFWMSFARGCGTNGAGVL
jgi:hypothetical protein